jgi:fibronectin type 3 domain-containing protein
MTTTAQLTVAVNTSGLAAGTYNATITIRVGKATTTVPVTLTVSTSQPPPSATTATLAWSPVNDPTLDGYKVYVGTASGLYTRTIPVGNLTSYTVDSLTTGTTYYFAVTAYNTAGESSPSNEVSKSIY